jgi:hypothetical protein
MLSVAAEAVKRVAAISLLRRPRAEVVPPLRHLQASQATVEVPPLWHPRATVVAVASSISLAVVRERVAR